MLTAKSGTTKQIFKAHRGPVTSLATIKTAALGKATHLLFTGSWDKTINIWNADVSFSPCGHAESRLVDSSVH